MLFLGRTPVLVDSSIADRARPARSGQEDVFLLLGEKVAEGRRRLRGYFRFCGPRHDPASAVYSDRNHQEKLDDMHNNPVVRRLVKESGIGRGQAGGLTVSKTTRSYAWISCAEMIQRKGSLQTVDPGLKEQHFCR